MSEVRRYDLATLMSGTPIGMKECAEGGFVRFEDYELVRVERDELRLALERCAKAVGGHVAQSCSHRFHVLIADEVEHVMAEMRK